MTKILTPAQKEKGRLLTEMTALSKDLKCHGPMGELSLTDKEAQEIPLSQLAWIGVMYSDPELVRNALALGANPEHKIKGKSLIQLAKAFKDEEISNIIAEFTSPEATASVKPEPARHTRHKKRPTKK